MTIDERQGSAAADDAQSATQGEWSELVKPAQQASVLVIGEGGGPVDCDTVVSAATACGLRVLGCLGIADGTKRLSQLVDVDAVVVLVPGRSDPWHGLLARLDMMAIDKGTTVVAVTDLAGLDVVHDTVTASSAMILCNPDTSELAVVLTALAIQRPTRLCLYDIDSETEASRIERMSDQLFYLTRTIEWLQRGGAFAPWGLLPDDDELQVRSPSLAFAPEQRSAPAVTSHQVRAVLRARRLREQFVAADLFADPAWDILLDLMAAHLEGKKVSVSSLCIAAAVPPTTALRWIRQLTDRGLLERRSDPRDGRRIFIALAGKGVDAVTRWFDESRKLLGCAAG